MKPLDVRLFPLTLRQATATYGWLKDPFIRKNLVLRNNPTLKKTRDWLQKSKVDKSILAFGIRFRGRHCGNIVFDRIEENPRRARLWIFIGESAVRGMGVATSALVLALKLAFEDEKMEKIWLRVHPENLPAIHLYRKFGFSFELDHNEDDLLYMRLHQKNFAGSTIDRF